MAYKILVVDDDRDVRIPVRRYLESSGFEVVEADSAAAGAAAFHREIPDAVLLDFALPDGDALEVLPLFKTAAPDVPIIILTGHGSIERAVQSVKETAQDGVQTVKADGQSAAKDVQGSAQGAKQTVQGHASS